MVAHPARLRGCPKCQTLLHARKANLPTPSCLTPPLSLESLALFVQQNIAPRLDAIEQKLGITLALKAAE